MTLQDYGWEFLFSSLIILHILSMRLLFFYFFFFFQAEDGIRDHCVTGVQTCALPISRLLPEGANTFVPNQIRCGRLERVSALGQQAGINSDRSAVVVGADELRARSEERRVGKEGRSRWSPYH